MTAVCNKCETKNWTFMYGYLAELVEIVKRTECDIIADPYPSEQILLDWCKLYKVERLVERDLTEAEESQVTFLRYLLSADDKWIWEELA